MSDITGRSVFTGKNIRLRIDKSRILEVEETGEGEKLPFISPGFIDTQMNGYKGLDYSTENLEIKDILKLTEILAEAGTTCHFPTIVTNSRELITRNLILVSDAVLLGGLKPGRYSWGGIKAEVFEDGHIGLADTEYLAGAGHLPDHCMAWLMNELETSIADAAAMCTANPSKIFFPANPVPGLNPGDPANLTLFRWKRGDSKLDVLETWRDGRSVYKAG